MYVIILALLTSLPVTYIDETASWMLGNVPDDGTTSHPAPAASPSYNKDDTSDAPVRPVYEVRHYPTASESSIEDHQIHISPRRHAIPRSQAPPAGKIFDSTASREISDSPHQTPSHDGQLPSPTHSAGSLSHLSLPHAFSAMDETEAHLFRHYVQRLAVCVSITIDIKKFLS